MIMKRKELLNKRQGRTSRASPLARVAVALLLAVFMLPQQVAAVDNRQVHESLHWKGLGLGGLERGGDGGVLIGVV